jgi:hypothetical protein
MFHYNADSTDGEIVVPGTSIKVIAFFLNGLTSKELLLVENLTMFIGCDLDGEEDSVNAVYLPETEKVKIKVSYKYGVQIHFTRSCNT